MNFLKGKRTYLTVLAAVIGVLLAVANGEQDMATAIGTIGMLFAQAFLRSGSKADAQEAVEKITNSASE